MLRFLLALVLIAASALPSFADGPKYQIDPAYGAAYVQTRIVNLPQDQDRPYLSVIGDPKNAQVRTLNHWFDTNADLIAFKNQTHFVFQPTTGDTQRALFFRERYGSKVGTETCVLLQKADGTPIVELRTNQIPATPEALVNALNRPATECFRRRHNQPGPDGKGDRDPAPAPLPDNKKPAPQPARFPWVLWLLSLAAGAGLGVAQKYQETYAKQ